MVLPNKEHWCKSNLLALNSYDGFFLTFKLPWVTKTKFLLTISTQYQAYFIVIKIKKEVN